MTALILSLFIELGGVNNYSVQYPKDNIYEEWANALYVDIGARLSYGIFYLDANTRTDMVQPSIVKFWPLEAGYGLGLGITTKNIDIGWRHYCFHPVIPYQYADAGRRPSFEGGGNTFFVKGKVTLQGGR